MLNKICKFLKCNNHAIVASWEAKYLNVRDILIDISGLTIISDRLDRLS